MMLARYLTAAALVAATAASVVMAQREHGVVRDEQVYMYTGERYADFWLQLARRGSQAATKANITQHFGGPEATANNREHPPLMKTLFGFSQRLFQQKLAWVSPITAYRLPTAALHGLFIALVFLFVSGRWGYAQGCLAAILTHLMPRAFFHAGLATFDAPIAALWFATLYAYQKALWSRWRWSLVFGICFGLALATKHNALFLLPAAILVHYAWLLVRTTRRQVIAPGRAGWGRALWRSLIGVGPFILPAMVVVGPLVLVALWPWLWFDTLDHAADWIRFHLGHVHYNYEYLGKNWNAPPYPWHVPIVTTALVVPVATLAAAVIGAASLLRRAANKESVEADRAPALLLFLSAGAAMGPFVTTVPPIFGAEKHWSPALVTISIYAGIGAVVAARAAAARMVEAGWVGAAQARWASFLTQAIVYVCVVTAAATETVAAQPYALSHYNALAGGAPGGADLGMNRQFWGYAARGVLPFVNQRAAAAERLLPVYTHDASPSWALYHRQGLLDTRVRDAGYEIIGIFRSELALVIHELHFTRHDALIWDEYGTVQPVFVLTTDGVPIVSVYARPRK